MSLNDANTRAARARRRGTFSPAPPDQRGNVVDAEGHEVIDNGERQQQHHDGAGGAGNDNESHASGASNGRGREGDDLNSDNGDADEDLARQEAKEERLSKREHKMLDQLLKTVPKIAQGFEVFDRALRTAAAYFGWTPNVLEGPSTLRGPESDYDRISRRAAYICITYSEMF